MANRTMTLGCVSSQAMLRVLLAGGVVVVGGGCDNAPAEDLEDVGAARQQVLDGTEDTGDQIRAVVNIGGCTGTLISDRVVLTAAHCFAAQAMECTDAYAPHQNANPALPSGRVIRITPPGVANTDDPNSERVIYPAYRVMPGHHWHVVDECCGGNGGASCSAYCVSDADQDGQPDNAFHEAGSGIQILDVAVLYLDQPVQGIAPEKFVRFVNSNQPDYGAYPFDPASLLGTRVVKAGTSRTSQHSPGRYRAYGVDQVTDMTMPNDTVVRPGSCSLTNPTLDDFEGALALMLFNPRHPAVPAPFKGTRGARSFSTPSASEATA